MEKNYIKPGAMEYVMPMKFAKELLRLKKDKFLTNQQWLINYVNEECNLKYQCTKVTLV